MGCSVSKNASNVFVKPRVDDVLIDELQFTGSEIRKLHGYFKRYDSFGTGKLLIYNFVTASRIDFSVFFRRVLGLFDSDQNGKVCFREFVCSLWSFLTISPENMSTYIYELYDETNSGRVNITELKHMLRDLHRSNYDRSDGVLSAVGLLDRMRKRELSRDEVLQWMSSYSLLLEPALRLQNKIRHIIISEKFWKRIQARRAFNKIYLEESYWATHKRLRKLLSMSSSHDKLFTQLIVSDKNGDAGSTNGSSCLQIFDSHQNGHLTPLPFPSPAVNDVIPQEPGLSPAGEERQCGDEKCHIVDDMEEFLCQQDGFVKVKPSAKQSHSMEERSHSTKFSNSAANMILSRQGSKVFSVVDLNLDESSSQGTMDGVPQSGHKPAEENSPMGKIQPIESNASVQFFEAVRKKLEGDEFDDLSVNNSQQNPRLTIVSPEGERADNMSDISEHSLKEMTTSGNLWQSEDKSNIDCVC